MYVCHSLAYSLKTEYNFPFFLLLCVRLIIRAMGVTVLLHGRDLAEKYLLKYICKNSITPFVRTYFSFK